MCNLILLHVAGAFPLAHSLGNAFMFYKQFRAAVEQSMQTLVAPVEKEFNVSSNDVDKASCYLF